MFANKAERTYVSKTDQQNSSSNCYHSIRKKLVTKETKRGAQRDLWEPHHQKEQIELHISSGQKGFRYTHLHTVADLFRLLAFTKLLSATEVLHCWLPYGGPGDQPVAVIQTRQGIFVTFPYHYYKDIIIH